MVACQRTHTVESASTLGSTAVHVVTKMCACCRGHLLVVLRPRPQLPSSRRRARRRAVLRWASRPSQISSSRGSTRRRSRHPSRSNLTSQMTSGTYTPSLALLVAVPLRRGQQLHKLHQGLRLAQRMMMTSSRTARRHMQQQHQHQRRCHQAASPAAAPRPCWAPAPAARAPPAQPARWGMTTSEALPALPPVQPPAPPPLWSPRLGPRRLATPTAAPRQRRPVRRRPGLWRLQHLPSRWCSLRGWWRLQPCTRRLAGSCKLQGSRQWPQKRR